MIPSTIHPSWHSYLKPLFESDAMAYIKNELLPSAAFCPKPNQIFRVLQMPLDAIKVVIIGQDPYPNPEHACGLAFAVPKNTPPPYSLGKIIDEIALSVSYDITLMGGEDGEFDETLEHWVDQGVFLLNRALTCQQGLSNSHSKEWEGFTRKIIEIIAKEREGIIWMLWGNDAQTVTNVINDSGKNHNILTAYHPAAERYGYKFLGCKHFVMANEILADQGKEEINWA